MYTSKDKFIDPAAIKALAREIDKFAAKNGLKESEILYTSKVVPAYDKDKAKAGGDAFTKKRAQLIKSRKRMPAAGSRVKMVVVLRLYKDLPDDFYTDVNKALDAIDMHNEKATYVIADLKDAASKKREVDGAKFDKNLAALQTVLLDGGIKASDIVLGQSTMGKNMVIRLPNGGFVSIGKADEAKFSAAKEAARNSNVDKPSSKAPVTKTKETGKRREEEQQRSTKRRAASATKTRGSRS